MKINRNSKIVNSFSSSNKQELNNPISMVLTPKWKISPQSVHKKKNKKGTHSRTVNIYKNNRGRKGNRGNKINKGNKIKSNKTNKRYKGKGERGSLMILESKEVKVRSSAKGNLSMSKVAQINILQIMT